MDIQEAIQFWKDCRANGSDFVEAKAMAIAALQERAEREKGCDFCKKELDDYPYVQAVGERDESDTIYEPAYCPICGRKLVE